MALFALTPLEGGSEIALTDGKVTVGRGPFLRVKYYTENASTSV